MTPGADRSTLAAFQQRGMDVGAKRWMAGLVCVAAAWAVAAEPVAPAPGSVWRLVTLVRDGQEETPPAAVTLEFAEQGGVGGSAGINRYTGRVRVEADGTLRWNARGLSTTRMAGDPAAMAFEARYLHALMRATRAQVGEDGRLILDDSEGVRRLLFEPQR